MSSKADNSRWQAAAPWILTAAAFASLLAIGAFLIFNIEWFKTQVEGTSDLYKERADAPFYRVYFYHLHLSFLKRSVGLFSGFALMFTGLGVAFYTLKSGIDLGMEAVSLKSKLATASPGIVCVVVGAVTVMTTVASTDQFEFEPPTSPGIEERQPPPDLVSPLPTEPDAPASTEL